MSGVLFGQIAADVLEACYERTAHPGKNGPKFKKVISSLDMLLFEFLTRKK